jgi:hypothetical protein
MVSIRTKDMDVAPINLETGDFAWCQGAVVDEVIRQYNLGLPVRIIILKARQLGLSTVSAAIVFNWILIFEGCSALVIAHDTETTQSLFEKIQDAWEWWPFKGLLNLKHASQRRLTIQETGSTVRIATARNVKSGRGRTIQAKHSSEMSFWEDPETLMSGLSKTMPRKHGTIDIIECTANGVGNLYWQMWTDAVAEKSDYVALFFPWWKHPEYVAEETGLTYRDLDEYERWLFDELFADTMDVAERLLRVEWRRWAVVNECHGSDEEFQQEYPATADEAFLKTGRNVFPLDKLMENYVPKRGIRGYLMPKAHGQYEFVRDPHGELTVFRYPSSDKSFGDYMVAGDPTSVVMGDAACIQVINRRTLEQVAVWHGRIDPVNFADKIIELGRYYNEAEVSTEIEGPGYATIGAILAKQYPRVWQHRWADRHPGRPGVNYGWSTNRNRKHWMMQQTVKLLVDHALLIHDQETYDQMRDYGVIDAFGEMGPVSPKGFDDAVMAFCQAIICSITEAPPDAYDPGQLGGRRPPKEPNSDIMGVPPWEAFGNAQGEVA